MKLVTLVSITALSTILGVTGIASAQRIDVEAFNQELAALERSLVHPAPGPGLDRASSGPPRWCPGGPVKDIKWPSAVASELQQYRANKQPLLQPNLVSAAAAVCTYNAPGYQRAATEILQYWINETGLSEADAVASLAARIDPDAWQADHDQVCHALRSGDPHDKEQNELVEARVRLFGCDGTSHSIGVGWMIAPSQGLFGLYPFLDRGAMERDRDEIVRLAYLSTEINLMLDPRQADHPMIARYAIVQYDLHELAPGQAIRQLDAPPYQGSRFARTVVVETIAHTKLTAAKLETAVASRARDPHWNELLVTAPQRASDAWLAAADRHRDVLARSDAITAAIKASDEAARGCEATLRRDLAPIVKSLVKPGANGPDQVWARLASDPVLGLLVRRLAACIEFAGDRRSGEMLQVLAATLGVFRGPRAAAYAAATRIHGVPADALRELPEVGPRTGDGLGELTRGQTGVVQSVTPAGKDGAVKLTFVPQLSQHTVQSCRETNKVDKVRTDGTVVYRQVCHAAGTAWGDEAPKPFTVPASCRAGLAKGRTVQVNFDGPGMVFTDKSKKHLVALACLALE
jgi:hypothetical protein